MNQHIGTAAEEQSPLADGISSNIVSVDDSAKEVNERSQDS
jgi:methyl-accepting chemotaxis protein